MVQIFEKAELERKEIFVIFHEKEEIDEKIKEKIEQKPKKKLFKKYSKSHEKQIDINKARRNLDAKLHTNKFMMR
jgi:hypothetical protein